MDREFAIDRHEPIRLGDNANQIVPKRKATQYGSDENEQSGTNEIIKKQKTKNLKVNQIPANNQVRMNKTKNTSNKDYLLIIIICFRLILDCNNPASERSKC